MADEGRSREAREMQEQGHSLEAAAHLIEGLSEEDLGLDDIQEPELPEDDEEESEAEDDAPEEPEEVEVDDAEDDEDSEEASDSPDDEEPAHLDLTDEALDSLVTIKVNGEEQDVTLREALAGTMRQEAFTRKTQELAEQRKAIAQELEQKRAERQKYAEGLERLEAVYKTLAPEEPDWDKIKAERPEDYPDLYRAFQEQQKDLEAIEKQREHVRKEAQEELEAALQEARAERDEILMATIPGWDDVETAQQEFVALAEYAFENYGVQAQEIDNVVNPNLFLMLRKAKLYDEMKEKGGEARKKAKKTITLKPGSKGSSKSSSKKKAKKAARSRLSKTGSVRDAAAALETFGLID